MASGSTSSNVVGVHYRVGKKIGEGSFGVIFEGTNLLNQQQVAIKFEPRKSEAPQLRDEYRTYKVLVGCRKSFPHSPIHRSEPLVALCIHHRSSASHCDCSAGSSLDSFAACHVLQPRCRPAIRITDIQ